MADRLISASSLWTDIMMLPHNGDIISSEEVEQAIKDAPAVDAVPVVHGHWIKQYYEDPQGGYYLFHCSECCVPNARERNYCPDCGAKMDGEEV